VQTLLVKHGVVVFVGKYWETQKVYLITSYVFNYLALKVTQYTNSHRPNVREIKKEK